MIPYKQLFIAGILLISLFFFPYNLIPYDGYIRCCILAILACGFSLYTLTQKKTICKIGLIDLFWLVLVMLTGASSIWSANAIYAVTGAATTFLLYLCFKIFESVRWKEEQTKFIWIGLLVCFLSSFTVECWVGIEGWLSKGTFSIPKQEVGNFTSRNANWHNSLQLCLLPFLLWSPLKLIRLCAPLLWLGFMTVAYVSDSAFTVLLGGLLLLVYLYWLSNLPFYQIKIIATAVLGIGGLFLGGYYYQHQTLHGISPVINEFYDTHDRLWMWKTSIDLFLESPIFGVGKNSWPIETLQFGISDCWECNGSGLTQSMTFIHAHNGFFQLLSELGVIGLSCYLGIGFFVIRKVLAEIERISLIEMASLVSLLLFLGLSMIYGVVYNYFNHFGGLPIFAMFCLGILTSTFNLNSFLSQKKVYSFRLVFFLTSILTTFLFFYLSLGYHSYQKGSVLLHHKAYESAETCLKFSSLYWDEGIVNKKLGAICEATNRREQAIIHYEKALAITPYQFDWHYTLARLKYEAGDVEGAKSSAENCYQVAEEHIPNLLLLTKCLLQLGDSINVTIISKKLAESDLYIQVNQNKKKSSSMEEDTNLLKTLSTSPSNKKELQEQIRQILDRIEAFDK